MAHQTLTWAPGVLSPCRDRRMRHLLAFSSVADLDLASRPST